MIQFNLLHFESLNSTQKYCIDNHLSLSNGSVIYCNEQTSGIGQRNNIWHSLQGNLFSSMVLKNIKTANNSSFLIQILSLSICKMLQYIGLSNVTIKWPNDIYVNDKKIAGVIGNNLNDKHSTIILGMGINVNMTYQQIDDLKLNATSIFIEKNDTFSIKETLFFVLNNFNKYYKLYIKDYAKIIELWEKNNYLTNKTIYFKNEDKITKGKILSFDKYGGAIIEYDSKIKTFYSNEIQLSKNSL